MRSLSFSCRTLKTSKSDESYLPCTLAYLRVSAMVLIEEHSAVSRFLSTHPWYHEDSLAGFDHTRTSDRFNDLRRRQAYVGIGFVLFLLLATDAGK